VVHGLRFLTSLLVFALACGAPELAARINTPGVVNPYPDRQTLLADPAAQIRMPEADELQRVGAERRTTPEGHAAAFDGAIFGTQAAPEEVHRFYDSALRHEGWQPDTYQVYPTSTDLKVWGWCKPELLFRVAIVDPETFSPDLRRGRSYTSLFHATINGRAADVPCPSR
jgi:hypothetical protein